MPNNPEIQLIEYPEYTLAVSSFTWTATKTYTFN